MLFKSSCQLMNLFLEAETGARMHRICNLTFEMAGGSFTKQVLAVCQDKATSVGPLSSKQDDQPTFRLHWGKGMMDPPLSLSDVRVAAKRTSARADYLPFWS